MSDAVPSREILVSADKGPVVLDDCRLALAMKSWDNDRLSNACRVGEGFTFVEASELSSLLELFWL